MIPEFTPLTIAQVMSRTGRSRRTIDRWIKDGHLRTVDIGGVEGRVLIEKEVALYEKQMRDNQKSSRAAGQDPAAEIAT